MAVPEAQHFDHLSVGIHEIEDSVSAIKNRQLLHFWMEKYV
ncbi:MAG TPA: hypothetical protein VIT91_07155 [Chthoniobacterales bacterium]